MHGTKRSIFCSSYKHLSLELVLSMFLSSQVNEKNNNFMRKHIWRYDLWWKFGKMVIGRIAILSAVLKLLDMFSPTVNPFFFFLHTVTHKFLSSDCLFLHNRTVWQPLIRIFMSKITVCTMLHVSVVRRKASRTKFSYSTLSIFRSRVTRHFTVYNFFFTKVSKIIYCNIFANILFEGSYDESGLYFAISLWIVSSVQSSHVP